MKKGDSEKDKTEPHPIGMTLTKAELVCPTHHGSVPLDRAEAKDFDIDCADPRFLSLRSKKSQTLLLVPWSNVAALHYRTDS